MFSFSTDIFLENLQKFFMEQAEVRQPLFGPRPAYCLPGILGPPGGIAEPTGADWPLPEGIAVV